jgi:vitamin-K-epoxide reductase (warfarin-sensitive)
MRYLIAILALAGALVAGLALQVHYSNTTEPCSINEKWDCGVVNHSPYAELEGIPVAGIGIVGYLILTWLTMAKQRGLLMVLTVGGLAYSLYLGYIEKDVLGVWCLYCVISLGLITFMTVLSSTWFVAGLMKRGR